MSFPVESYSRCLPIRVLAVIVKFRLTSLGFPSGWFLCLKSELDLKLDTSLPLELLLLKILKLTLIIWLLQLTPRKHSTNTGSLRNLHNFVMTAARVFPQSQYFIYD